MLSKYITVLIILAAAMTGCKQETCPETCGLGINIIVTGFTPALMAGARVVYYTANNSFTDSLSSNALDSANWAYYPLATDSGNTLIMWSAIDLESTLYDVKIVIPATNESYQISGMAFSGGGLNQNVDCYEGGKISPCSATFLQSYRLNGNITYPAYTNSNPANIYIQK